VHSTFLRLATALLVLVALGCPPTPPPAGPTYTVRLTSPGADPAAVIAAVVSTTGYTETVATKLVEQAANTGVPLGTGLERAEADARADALRAAGATASVLEVPPEPQ
jgi:hypothetical protein